ncbi:MAG: pentapeptide repeat-containing protein [Gammaproteobacteria bacterium]
MNRPRISDDPLYQLLREGDIKEFNRRRAAGEACVVAGCDLSRLDLRGMDARGLDFSDCYFRMSDVRGIDFRQSRLEGSSFAAANVSGCYFPPELRAEELQCSIAHGTRVRYYKC